MAGNDGRLPGITLPADWYAMLMSLDDATLAALIRAAIRYADTRTDTDQHGPTRTDAVGLKAKAAPIWMIMRSEFDRQIERRQRIIDGTRKAINARWARQKANTQTDTDGHGPTRTEHGDDTTEYDRIRSNTNVYDRIRTYGGGNPAPKNTDPESHKSRNDNDKIRTYTNVYERIHAGGGARAVKYITILYPVAYLRKRTYKRKPEPMRPMGPMGLMGQIGRIGRIGRLREMNGSCGS